MVKDGGISDQAPSSSATGNSGGSGIKDESPAGLIYFSKDGISS